MGRGGHKVSVVGDAPPGFSSREAAAGQDGSSHWAGLPLARSGTHINTVEWGTLFQSSENPRCLSCSPKDPAAFPSWDLGTSPVGAVQQEALAKASSSHSGEAWPCLL